MAAHAIGDTALATDFLDRSEDAASEGRLGLLPHVLGMQVHIRLELGDWRGRPAAAAEVHQLSAETGQPIWSLNNVTCDAQAQALRGDGSGPWSLSPKRSWSRTGSASTTPSAWPGWRAAPRCSPRAATARPTQRCAACSTRSTRATTSARASPASRSWPMRPLRPGYRDDGARDPRARSRARPLTPSPILRIHLAYARAVLADEDARRAALPRRARRRPRRWPWPRARLDLAYGGTLTGTGRPDSARHHLDAPVRCSTTSAHAPWIEDAEAAIRCRAWRESS